ncbi:transglutaminase family protein [Alteromonadaceae bacterium BrNp21-10]|nr:transglutaminase family protein [Alteromonadaceae bacterium BrNp21-10]
MPSYRVTHSTIYNFNDPVDHLTLQCCLYPGFKQNQQLHHHQLISQPLPSLKTEFTDEFGNLRHQLSFTRQLQRVAISSLMSISVAEGSHNFFVEEHNNCPLWVDLLDEQERQQVESFSKSFAKDIFNSKLDDRKIISMLMEKIYRDFIYDTRATSVNTPVSHLFKSRRGVCQDFARVMIAILQTHGFDARYVSGYLYGGGNQQGSTIRQPASHAWLAVNILGSGWAEIDPTNNMWVDDRYIALAWGRDYIDIVPLEGKLQDTRKQRINVSVTIEKQDNSN